MRASLTGDWESAGLMLQRLTKMTPLAEARLYEDGELVLKRMVDHISSQDLGWSPLAPETVAMKKSNLIYIETDWLRNNLDVTKVNEHTLYIGASAKKTHPSGLNFNELMIYMEYGTSTQPARPLVRPTWEEMRPKIESNWRDFFKNLIMKMR